MCHHKKASRTLGQRRRKPVHLCLQLSLFDGNDRFALFALCEWQGVRKKEDICRVNKKGCSDTLTLSNTLFPLPLNLASLSPSLSLYTYIYIYIYIHI